MSKIGSDHSSAATVMVLPKKRQKLGKKIGCMCLKYIQHIPTQSNFHILKSIITKKHNYWWFKIMKLSDFHRTAQQSWPIIVFRPQYSLQKGNQIYNKHQWISLADWMCLHLGQYVQTFQFRRLANIWWYKMLIQSHAHTSKRTK